jgi:7,8-dihydropterin-6-yl-methyl-4-(beta-D-ribofuranosyl)aminobenzene 5'-phosphate synthase
MPSGRSVIYPAEPMTVRDIMKATVLCVYDQGALEGMQYIGAKGASLLIEVDGQRTLFGTGMRPRYLEHNMDRLGIDPGELDRVVVSHGHRDIVGGLEAVLSARRSQIQVLASPSSLGRQGRFGGRGLRIAPGFSDLAAVTAPGGWVRLSENLHLTPPLPFPGGDECFLVLTAGSGPAVLGSCAHCGFGTVAREVHERFGGYPASYIGGLHITGRDRNRSRRLAGEFRDLGCTDLHLNHCTCPDAIADIRAVLGTDAVGDLHVGMTVTHGV